MVYIVIAACIITLLLLYGLFTLWEHGLHDPEKQPAPRYEIERSYYMTESQLLWSETITDLLTNVSNTKYFTRDGQVPSEEIDLGQFQHVVTGIWEQSCYPAHSTHSTEWIYEDAHA
jgi:hypothetical protein